MALFPDQGTPEPMQQNYESYKRSTKIALAWLQDKGSLPVTQVKSTGAVAKVLALAKSIRDKGIAPPSDIAYAFRDAISQRKQMTKFYNGQMDMLNDSTQRHEAFTETLQQAYDIVSSVKSPRPEVNKPKIDKLSPTVSPEPPKVSPNKFDYLQSTTEQPTVELSLIHI